MSYCVQCGVILTNDSARGLVCTSCFNANRANVHERKRPPDIQVRFCLACGESLEPTEHEVTHGQCRGIVRSGALW